MTTQADFDKAYDYLRDNHTRNDFYKSLFMQFESKGVLSEKQILAVLRGIERDRNSAKASLDPVTEIGMYPDGETVYSVKHNKQKTAMYAMRFVPEGATKSDRFVFEGGAFYRLTASMRMTVPECAELGQHFSMCVICGADLTDPKSVARGMGSTCAGKV